MYDEYMRTRAHETTTIGHTMRYPTESEIHTLVVDRLHLIAPGFTLMHFTAETMHEGAFLTVCAQEGLNRLTIEAKAWSEFVMTKRFVYIGTMPCPHTAAQWGYDNRVKLMMDSYPDAHIQHIDNEEDGDDAVFGYVAYDENFVPLAWAPIPIIDGTFMHQHPAYMTHTVPAGVWAEMDFIRDLAIEQYE